MITGERLGLDESHELFRQGVRTFLQREVIPNAEKWDRAGMLAGYKRPRYIETLGSENIPRNAVGKVLAASWRSDRQRPNSACNPTTN